MRGADIYTLFFQKVMSGRKENNEKYFYASYEEKLKETPPEVYGLYYRDLPVSEGNPEPVRRFVIASNREKGLEYRIIVKPNEKKAHIVKDYGEIKCFELPLEQHGVCTITCRKSGLSRAVVKEMDINY